MFAHRQGPAGRAASGLRVARWPWKGLAALTEVRNKLEVYALVRHVDRWIGIPDAVPLPLDALLARAYGLGPYRALWAVEGLGHRYAASWFEAGREPEGLLTGRDLPPESLLMMHAGIGLGFAERLLEGVSRETPTEALRSHLSEFLRLCRESARPGYLGAAYESLGLVAGFFHPGRVGAIDRALRELGADDVVGLYWHGVGRSIYFRPANFLPASTWRVFESARRAAPDETARKDAWAGLAWAVTLVNQRHPQVLSELLVEPHGEELARDDAFANGVASANVMREDTTPGAPFVAAFSSARPRGGERVDALWEELVARPCRRALEDDHPALRGEGRLDSVFRYRPMHER